MSSVLVSIGNAVLQEINEKRLDTESPWSLAFPPAERIYDPERPLEDTEELRVDVVLGDVDTEIGTRDSEVGDYRIDIVFRRSIEGITRSDKIDALADDIQGLVEEIGQFFRLRRLERFPEAIWATSKVFPYSPKKFREDHQFFGILRLTYRAYS